MVIITASGSSTPFMTRNSSVLSSMAESEPSPLITGNTFSPLLAHKGAGHGLFPGQHPVGIAPDGVDLAVVQDHPVGMGPLPAGIGVGGKAGVHQRDGALAVRAGQIRIEPPQLLHQEHALIYNRTEDMDAT